jgi:hypothetical protein
MSIQFIWTYLKSLNIYSMDSQLKAISQTRFNRLIDTLVVFFEQLLKVSAIFTLKRVKY